VIIGIDLGTTNSAAAFMDGDEPVVIPNDRGNRITPSVVAVNDSGDILVGEAAKNQAVINAERTVLAVKRRMGSSEVIQLGDRAYSPEEISSFILRKIRLDCEGYLGSEVREAVITVPAHFSERQRTATKEAGRLAGLRVLRIVNEPTAAALAYAHKTETSRNILVYDLGGGTFDVTCLIKEGDSFRVRSTVGDNHLGGVDFDRLMLERVLDDFESKSGLSIRTEPVLLQQLMEMVESAKIDLSTRDSALVALPFIGGSGKPVHLSYTIRRDELNELIAELVKRTINLTLKAVREGGFGVRGIDSLVLSGGSSRIPLVHTYLRRALGLEKVALVNPDEIVAMGAAVQASILQGQGGSVQDVLSYTLGVEIEGDQFVGILQRNTPLPADAKKLFTTVADNQSAVEIHVLQGEEEKAGRNISLGRFLLSGIREAKRGEPRVEVDFAVDPDGIVQVSAADVDTGARQQISVRPADAAEAGADAMSLTLRVESLVNRVQMLCEGRPVLEDPALATEIDEIVRIARDAMASKKPRDLTEARIALETILGELNAAYQATEVEDEGA
jgi:molecular chaperone DnaK